MSNVAFAIGDSSGGCQNPKWTELAASGNPEILSAAVEAAANNIRTPLGKLKKSPWSLFPKKPSTPQNQASQLPLDEAIRKVVNTPYDCNRPQGVRLLDLATAAGNLQNIGYLLKVGADPNAVESQKGGETVFMRCIDLRADYTVSTPFWEKDRTPVQIARKLEAYSYLLKNGGDINAKTQRGLTALHLCDDPSSIALYLKSGAVASTAVVTPSEASTPLDLRVYQVVTSKFLPSREQSLPISLLLASTMHDTTVSRRTEDAICYFCSGTEITEECKVLSKVLTVRDKRIFNSKGYTTNENSRIFRCSALLEPNCKDCPWQKFYKLENE